MRNQKEIPTPKFEVGKNIPTTRHPHLETYYMQTHEYTKTNASPYCMKIQMPARPKLYALNHISRHFLISPLNSDQTLQV